MHAILAIASTAPEDNNDAAKPREHHRCLPHNKSQTHYTTENIQLAVISVEANTEANNQKSDISTTSTRSDSVKREADKESTT